MMIFIKFGFAVVSVWVLVCLLIWFYQATYTPEKIIKRLSNSYRGFGSTGSPILDYSSIAGFALIFGVGVFQLLWFVPIAFGIDSGFNGIRYLIASGAALLSGIPWGIIEAGVKERGWENIDKERD